MIVRVIKQKQNYKIKIKNDDLTVKELVVLHKHGKIDWNNTNVAYFDAKEVLIRDSDVAVILVDV